MRPPIRITVALEWASYEAQVLPASAPPNQVRETRRAFYAGAKAMLGMMLLTADDEVSEDDGAEFLERRNRELDAFNAEVAAGRA